MALWFDVSDLCVCDAARLADSERTTIHVLAELLTLRDDVRLFGYDARVGDIAEVDGSALPAAVRRRVFGDWVPPASAGVMHVPDVAAAPAPSSRPHLAQLLHTLTRQAAAHAIAALDACRRTARALLAGRQTTDVPRPAISPTNPARLPAQIFMQSHDVCLSLSATWSMAGYAAAIARHKAATSCTCITLIHDLIPIQFPQWMAPGRSAQIGAWVRAQIGNADLVLTPSRFQKQDVEDFMRTSNLPLRPVRAIRLADDAELLARSEPTSPRLVPGRPFVLCVAPVDVHKNQLCLYHAWQRLAQELGLQCPELMLVGRPDAFGAQLVQQMRNDPLVGDLVCQVDDATAAELAWYYRHCLFTVFPSVYEGWGQPICESLALGKYCIASDATSLPEAGGALADYFDPLDAIDCARVIGRALRQPDYVAQKETLIAVTYRSVLWRRTAREISGWVDATRDISAAAPDKGQAAQA